MTSPAKKRARVDDDTAKEATATFYAVTYCECEYEEDNPDPGEHNEPTVTLGTNLFTSEQAARDFLRQQKHNKALAYLTSMVPYTRKQWPKCFNPDGSVNTTWAIIQDDALITDAIKSGRMHPFTYIVSEACTASATGSTAVADMPYRWTPTKHTGASSSSSSSDNNSDKEDDDDSDE